ncbi:MAG: response regulator, partial [Treponema sp.]|nr:response regulator [Treponema sp.]
EIDLVEFSAPDAKVLLVDDIDINLVVAEFLLNTFKIFPDIAKSGREAVDQAVSHPYDLILMDHMMPEMDGVEAAKIIREMENGQAAEHPVPIIALTANAISGAKEMFLANGFNGFLSKPMDAAALAECLLRWLPEALIVKAPDAV